MSRMTLIGVTGALSQPFPDFDKILDFTSAGAESSTSVNVLSNTDKEYKIMIFLPTDASYIRIRLNNDSGGNYGSQSLINAAGTISASRGTSNTDIGEAFTYGWFTTTILAPTGFIPTSFAEWSVYSSGTTMTPYRLWGASWNSTSQITTLDFVHNSGNFPSGTRIIAYKRRVNT